jgi:molybdopterin-guanine dinucleotide biosynthesis protein A
MGSVDDAGPDRSLDELRELRRLGRLADARDLVQELLGANPADPWALLLAAANVYADTGDDEATRRLLALCWRRALSRDRQASTLHAAGLHEVRAGDLDAGAGKLALALTMRRGFADVGVIAEAEQALLQVRDRIGMDVIVLAGGRGSRFTGAGRPGTGPIGAGRPGTGPIGAGRAGTGPAGFDKPGQLLGGWPLLDHVLIAAAGASRRIVVGPMRQALTEPVFCREEPPGSGPLAAIAAGAARLGQPLVAVLAADLPFIGGALGPLRAALAGNNSAVLVDPTGRTNYLAAVWRTDALRAALVRVGELAGRPVRALYEHETVSYLADFDAWGADCDTVEDLTQAAERFAEANHRSPSLGEAKHRSPSPGEARHRSPAPLAATPLAWPRLELFSPS